MSREKTVSPTQPTDTECCLYGTGGDFRGQAIRMYAHRLLVGEEQAEQAIRLHLRELGMCPDPDQRAQPLYEKLLN